MKIDDLKKSFEKSDKEEQAKYDKGRKDLTSDIAIEKKYIKALDIFEEEQTQDTQIEEPIPVKRKRGRPKGSKNIDRNAVKSKKLTISLSEDEVLQLKQYAKEKSRSVSNLIRLVLTEQNILQKDKSK